LGWPDRRPKASINIPRFMHAKSETIDVLPTFAESFRKRRGIAAVGSFNVYASPRTPLSRIGPNIR
jgi:hypothetical protein